MPAGHVELFARPGGTVRIDHDALTVTWPTAGGATAGTELLDVAGSPVG